MCLDVKELWAGKIKVTQYRENCFFCFLCSEEGSVGSF